MSPETTTSCHSCESVDAGEQLNTNDAASGGEVYSSNASLVSRRVPATGRIPRYIDDLDERGRSQCAFRLVAGVEV